MSRKFVTRALSKIKNKETKETKDIINVDNDVIILVGEEQQEFYGNYKLMRSKSDYFKKLLSDKNVEKKDEKYVIKIQNVSPQVFDVINKYLSTGQVDLTNKTGIEILNVIIACEDFKLNQLVKLIEESINEPQQFLQNDPVGVLQMVYSQKSLTNMQEICLKMICLEPEILFDSDQFVNLPASQLEIVLKQDDLNLIEIKVWEKLIKWGLAQEKTLDEDVTKWNKENFEAFEKILHKLIPLIRFYDINSEDYFNKVRPYEDILPKNILDDILKFHMIPGYTPTLDNFPRHAVDSVLIGPRYTALFASWISKKKGKINHRFSLLYRASRDGNTAAAFHERCDNKGATVVVVKVSDSEQIVGGYNPLAWDSSSGGKTTKDSFIFSFADKTNFQNAKVVYSNGGTNSIICNATNGPTFGNSDLYVNYNNNANNWTSTASTYPTLNLPSSFKVDDYEVFQVIKR